MTTRLTLTLNGNFAAETPDGPIDRIGRRGQAMLAYLALAPRQRATRAAVMTLLWGDRSEDQARASLRQELSTLRRALPEGTLDADRNDVWLENTVVDEAAAGEFLAGFDLRSEPFEDWLRETRQQARPTASAAPPASASGDRPSLAVLPFEDLTPGGEDFFADGVVEEITGALSRVREFDVIARQSVCALGPGRLGHSQVGAHLGVAYLLEGSIRRAGDNVRISVQLISADDGRTLWSERFDDRLDDLFALQDRIAAQVAGHIAPHLRTAEILRAGTKPPADRTAYELVLSAYPHFWSHRKDGNREALRFYESALARDPTYALALAMKAWCHAQEAAYIWSDDPARERALAAENADLAARHAGNHAPTLVAICAAISLTTDDQPRAKTFIDRALAVDPNSAWGWLRSGWLHCLFNEPLLALEHFARAERLSPLDPFTFNIQFGKANANAELGNYDEAIRLVKHGLDMAPGVEWAYRMLAAYCGMKGDEKGAADAAARYLRHYPGITIARMKASMPPSIFLTHKAYFEGMRRAGIPEE